MFQKLSFCRKFILIIKLLLFLVYITPLLPYETLLLTY